MELLKELAEPARLSHTISDSVVLSLNTGAGDHVLTFGGPGDEVVHKEHSVVGGGPTGVRAPRPVSVGVDCRRSTRGWRSAKEAHSRVLE